jgi:hypothetical protein
MLRLLLRYVLLSILMAQFLYGYKYRVDTWLMGGDIIQVTDYQGALFRKLTGMSNVKRWTSCEKRWEFNFTFKYVPGNSRNFSLFGLSFQCVEMVEELLRDHTHISTISVWIKYNKMYVSFYKSQFTSQLLIYIILLII